MTTIWARMTDRPFGSIVRTQAPAYPRPAAFIDDLDAESTLEDALALFGEPEQRGPEFLCYVVGGRYLHLEFGDDRFVKVTLMVEAP